MNEKNIQELLEYTIEQSDGIQSADTLSERNIEVSASEEDMKLFWTIEYDLKQSA